MASARRGGLHSKTFAKISATIQYGVAADTLAESRRTVLRVHTELYGPSDGPRHLDVSYNGTWKKRSFQSPIGVGFVIDVLTGLVVDYAVLCKYCVECELVGTKLSGDELETWKQLHADRCAINHVGSSGSMEAAKLMWARSVELMDAEYTSLLGDGDAAVLSALNTLRPYGADVMILKQECSNHISKRMFLGLAMAVKAPGSSLSGKGKLTQVRMKKWSTYYLNAIVAATRAAIWAIYLHSVSTLDEPQHDDCDVDWCWWQQAMAAGVDPEAFWQEGRPGGLLAGGTTRRPSGRRDDPEAFWQEGRPGGLLAGGTTRRPSGRRDDPEAFWLEGRHELPLPAAERLPPLFKRLSCWRGVRRSGRQTRTSRCTLSSGGERRSQSSRLAALSSLPSSSSTVGDGCWCRRPTRLCLALLAPPWLPSLPRWIGSVFISGGSQGGD